MSEVTKPCPHCGDKTSVEGATVGRNNYYMVCCPRKCMTGPVSIDRREAARLWNALPSPPQKDTDDE